MNKTKLAIVGAISAVAAMPMAAGAAVPAEQAVAPATAAVTLHGGTLQKADWVWVGHRRHWRGRAYYGYHRHHGWYGHGWRRHHRW